MSPSLWFVVPVYRRLQLTAICLRQLRRTCDALIEEGIAASAVIVGDSHDLRALRPDSLRFAHVIRDNEYVSRKFNDGIQLATDPKFNPAPADYVVPCGSDDWVDHRLFRRLPPRDTMYGFQQASFVREDGQEISSTFLQFHGGAGIRIIPRELVVPLHYRPADEDRERGCDTSIMRNLRLCHDDAFKVEHRHLHDRQIVDWKTPTTQLNDYTSYTRGRRSQRESDPFTELERYYPHDAIEEMRSLYAAIAEQVAA